MPSPNFVFLNVCMSSEAAFIKVFFSLCKPYVQSLSSSSVPFFLSLSLYLYLLFSGSLFSVSVVCLQSGRETISRGVSSLLTTGAPAQMTSPRGPNEALVHTTSAWTSPSLQGLRLKPVQTRPLAYVTAENHSLMRGVPILCDCVTLTTGRTFCPKGGVQLEFFFLYFFVCPWLCRRMSNLTFI